MNKELNLLLPSMKKILLESGLLEESVRNPSMKILIWRDLENYKKVWNDHYRNKTFHFRLIDHSLFRFLFIDKKETYEYLNCPYYIKEDFLEDIEPIETLPTPIRYDYEPSTFNPISHPIAHIHIGLDNSIRIATYCKLTPLSFLLFCLRQMYPNYWKNIFTNEDFKIHKRHIRKKSPFIKAEYKDAFKREHIIS